MDPKPQRDRNKTFQTATQFTEKKGFTLGASERTKTEIPIMQGSYVPKPEETRSVRGGDVDRSVIQLSRIYLPIKHINSEIIQLIHGVIGQIQSLPVCRFFLSHAWQLHDVKAGSCQTIERD